MALWVRTQVGLGGGIYFKWRPGGRPWWLSGGLSHPGGRERERETTRLSYCCERAYLPNRQKRALTNLQS
jgi:hypothetical protein